MLLVCYPLKIHKQPHAIFFISLVLQLLVGLDMLVIIDNLLY